MSELGISLKNLFLYALIVSVCASAVLGIIAILSGDSGDLQAKVLLTSLAISGASVGGLCCGAAFEAHRYVILRRPVYCWWRLSPSVGQFRLARPIARC